MKAITKKLATGSAAIGALLTPIAVWAADPPPTPAEVFKNNIDGGTGSARPTGAPGNLFGPGGLFQDISNILIFLVGAIAVIMVIIGGFRYVVSGGDSGAVKSAKDTILYGIIGVVVAILAYAIVNFVVGALT